MAYPRQGIDSPILLDPADETREYPARDFVDDLEGESPSESVYPVDVAVDVEEKWPLPEVGVDKIVDIVVVIAHGVGDIAIVACIIFAVDDHVFLAAITDGLAFSVEDDCNQE